MRCPDVEAQVEHEPHWHTIGAAGQVYAQGECPGYPPAEPYCCCPKRVALMDPDAPIPNRHLVICPVHHPRLYAMRVKNWAVRKGARRA